MFNFSKMLAFAFKVFVLWSNFILLPDSLEPRTGPVVLVMCYRQTQVLQEHLYIAVNYGEMMLMMKSQEASAPHEQIKFIRQVKRVCWI